jgi:uncharacterized repeat protein (TIGR04138 family)
VNSTQPRVIVRGDRGAVLDCESGMASNDTITTNLFCRSCAYNLRGLSLSGVCPECAEPIQNSLVSATSSLDRLLNEDPKNVARRLRFEEVAKSIGCSVDGLTFVVDAIREASGWKEADEYGAKHVCMAVRIHAVNYFNNQEEAGEMLASWGLKSGEDVGKIIFGLVRQGFMQSSPGDSIEQFSGLFDVEHLFPSGT